VQSSGREAQTGARRPTMSKMANPDPNVRRRNWIVLIVLVAVALAMYVGFMLKMRGYI
jgi:uncharacterized protein involved in exopolysaccharide biosynthesis